MADTEATTHTVTPGVSTGDPAFFEALDFLYYEAALLDNNQLHDWLERVAKDVIYRMPTRATVARGHGTGFSTGMYHFDETWATLSTRVARQMETQSAWAEEPPTRTRRFVSNVRVSSVSAQELQATSYTLLLRSRWDNPHYEFLSCERRDVLRRTTEGLVLAAREIFVDQSTLGVINLSVLL